MTSAATSHAIQRRNKGWRKAVRYALTENPVMDVPHPPPPVFELVMKPTVRPLLESPKAACATRRPRTPKARQPRNG